MTKVKRPLGLIRYDSLAGLRGEKTRWARPRTLVYLALLAVGAAVATWALSTLRPANVQLTRLGGTPYFVDAGGVRNQFLVRLVNKRHEPQRFVLRVSDPSMLVSGWSEAVQLAPLAEDVRPLILQLPRAAYTGPREIRVTISDEKNTFTLERTVEFIGPENLPPLAAPAP